MSQEPRMLPAEWTWHQLRAIEVEGEAMSQEPHMPNSDSAPPGLDILSVVKQKLESIDGIHIYKTTTGVFVKTPGWKFKVTEVEPGHLRLEPQNSSKAYKILSELLEA